MQVPESAPIRAQFFRRLSEAALNEGRHPKKIITKYFTL